MPFSAGGGMRKLEFAAPYRVAASFKSEPRMFGTTDNSSRTARLPCGGWSNGWRTWQHE